jgi:hypothetical protein
MLKKCLFALAFLPVFSTSSQALTCGVYDGVTQCGDFPPPPPSPTVITNPDSGDVSTCITTGTYTYCN